LKKPESESEEATSMDPASQVHRAVPEHQAGDSPQPRTLIASSRAFQQQQQQQPHQMLHNNNSMLLERGSFAVGMPTESESAEATSTALASEVHQTVNLVDSPEPSPDAQVSSGTFQQQQRQMLYNNSRLMDSGNFRGGMPYQVVYGQEDRYHNVAASGTEEQVDQTLYRPLMTLPQPSPEMAAYLNMRNQLNRNMLRYDPW
jgi:hypothetical protein